MVPHRAGSTPALGTKDFTGLEKIKLTPFLFNVIAHKKALDIAGEGLTFVRVNSRRARKFRGCRRFPTF